MILTAVSEGKYMIIRWFKVTTPVPSYVLNYHQIKLMPHFANSVSTNPYQPTKYVQTPSDVTVLNFKSFYRCFSVRIGPERNVKTFQSKHKKLHAFRTTFVVYSVSAFTPQYGQPKVITQQVRVLLACLCIVLSCLFNLL
jgi:hypothetical protein